MFVEVFDLEKTLTCGQCFHYVKHNDGYIVFGESSICYIEQKGNNININSKDIDYWKKYFSLDKNYKNINKVLISQCNKNNDFFAIDCINFASGIRILRQPLFETCCSYILSQQNNISRIQRMIFSLSEKYSSVSDNFDNVEYKLFPSYEDLKFCKIENFKELGFGYRAEYLYDFIQSWPEIQNKLLKTSDYESHFKLLKECNGIGDKVANCICLYGLNHLEAFPIDTWMKKVIDDEYTSKNRNLKLPSKNAGILQQYMFYTKRNRQ